MSVPPVPVVAPPTGSGGSGGGDPYGLGHVSGVAFDTTGLGIGTGTKGVTGSSLLSHFVQAGSGADPAGAAAIQHALYLAGFYPSSYVPQFGEVRKTDAQALATALNLLARANSAVPTGTGIGVTQYLTNQAALGVANSQASAAQTAVTVANIRTPSPTDVAAAAERGFQAVLGRKPTPAERDAFVASYEQNYTAIETSNARATYNAQVSRAQARLQASQQAAASPADKPAPTTDQFANAAQAGIIGDGLAHDVTQPGLGGVGAGIGSGIGDIGSMLRRSNQPPPAQPPTLDQSIQDLISASAQTSPTADSVFRTVTRQSPPDAGNAAQDFARNTHPQEAAGNDLAQTFDTFLGLLGGLGNGVH